jgi:hypothetical protein
MTGNYFITTLNPTLNDAGSTIIGTLKGIHVIANGAATETAGTLNMDTYGLHLDVDGKTFTNGATNNYGIYMDVDDDTNTNYGLYIVDTGTLNASIFDEGAGDWVIDNDNTKLVFGEDQDAEIYWDGTNLVIDANKTNSAGDVYVVRNISATGFITRTPALSNYQGNYLDSIKAPNQMLDISGKLNRNDLLQGEAVLVPTQDSNNCEEIYDYSIWIWEMNNQTYEQRKEPSQDIKDNFDVSEEKRYYTECGTKTEEGTSLDYMELNNRLLISELKEYIQELEVRIAVLESAKG